MDKNKTPEHIRIDERNHVEKPLLEQLAGLQWEILDLDKIQSPQQTFRDFFADIERRAANLEEDKKTAALERLALARTMIDSTDALQWLAAWKTPEER